MAPILLVTRPVQTAKAFARKVVSGLDIQPRVILSPALEVVPIKIEDRIPAAEHLILTSANGVTQAQRLIPSVDGQVWCVGQRTTELAKSAGYDAVCAGIDAAHLISYVTQRAPKGLILQVSGMHHRGDITTQLAAAGLNARQLIAYDQQIQTVTEEAKTALLGSLPVVIPVFSPRSAAILDGIAPSADVHFIAMSDAVRESLAEFDAERVKVVKVPDEDHMIKETKKKLLSIA